MGHLSPYIDRAEVEPTKSADAEDPLEAAADQEAKGSFGNCLERGKLMSPPPGVSVVI